LYVAGEKIYRSTRGERCECCPRRYRHAAQPTARIGGVFVLLIPFQRLGSLTVFAGGINSSASVIAI
jgi:hypothetical protein